MSGVQDNNSRTPLERRKRAISSFMVRVGQVDRTSRRVRCEHTYPLFPLALILDADGSLRADARDLVESVHA